MKEAIDFLRRLSLNNNRAWFQEHKEEYERARSQWIDGVDRMIARMCLWQPDLAGQSGKTSSYRIYRDTRFSPDKTPYKTFFSAAISPYGRKTAYAGYYLQVGVNEAATGLYGGLWCPAPDVLKKIRHAMIDNIEEFDSIITAPELEKRFPGWCGDSLKTIPKGWERNHPRAELLRLKDIGKFCHLPLSFFEKKDWPEEAADMMRLLKPMIDFLNYSIDE